MSVVFTLISAEILGNAGYVISFVTLLFFIALGVVFDIIGVAVTAAVPAPFHSMASHRQRGARESIRLLNSAEKVASICNDVVGDISGIVSGTTAAAVTARLMGDLSVRNILLQLIISGIVAALTIGGKAAGKSLAINRSTEIVLAVGKVLSVKTRISEKLKHGRRGD